MMSGPWLEIGTQVLKDISLQLDSYTSGQLIPDLSVWAVSVDGEVLYRIGVSRTNPQVCYGLILVQHSCQDCGGWASCYVHFVLCVSINVEGRSTLLVMVPTSNEYCWSQLL